MAAQGIGQVQFCCNQPLCTTTFSWTTWIAPHRLSSWRNSQSYRRDTHPCSPFHRPARGAAAAPPAAAPLAAAPPAAARRTAARADRPSEGAAYCYADLGRGAHNRVLINDPKKQVTVDTYLEGLFTYIIGLARAGVEQCPDKPGEPETEMSKSWEYVCVAPDDINESLATLWLIA